MTWADYEECYKEALLILKQSGLKVGTPHVEKGKKRLCPIDGEPTDDLGVLSRAFGEAVAVRIFGEDIT
jgi:hypothetical protein